MKNLKYLIYSFVLVIILNSCGRAGKKESSENEAHTITRLADSTHQNTSHESSNLDFVKLNYQHEHPEAGFELLFPKHMDRVEVGDIHYKFDTEKFPFVNGHSVRLAIEGGVERHVYDADKKVTIENKGSYLSAAFLCDKKGISLKDSGTYVFTQLNVGVNEKREIDLKQPMIFLNLPHSREGKYVVLDFFVHNLKIQKGGDRVRVSIDDNTEVYLHEWAPFQITGLTPGEHHILVELVNKDGETYQGPYTHDERFLDIQY